MSPRSIVFTGGGTAGHVTPNSALIHVFKQEGWDIAYIGSADGVEQTIIRDVHIPFYAISSGKLRRYFSIRNFIDPFKIIVGIFKSFWLLGKLKPAVVFSKGGFVAFPVVFAAFLHRIPIVAHESDMSPGLANRLCFPFVTKICLTFEAAKNHFKKQDHHKIEITGTPIREQLFSGSALQGLTCCGFHADKPCILVIGGSLGAASINRTIRAALPQLTPQFQVIHVCGKGKVDAALVDTEGYCQFEYVHEELADLFAAASIIISRSGANALYEILALGKPHILIPLSAKTSRGDQIQNAHYFQQLGISVVIQDEALHTESMLQAIQEVMQQKDVIKEKIQALSVRSATEKIVTIIKEHANAQLPQRCR